METVLLVLGIYFIIVIGLTIKWMAEARRLPDDFDE
jgi:hypothetical protein